MFKYLINLFLGLFRKPEVPSLEDTDPVDVEEVDGPWPEPPTDWDAEAHEDDYANDPQVVITEDDK